MMGWVRRPSVTVGNVTTHDATPDIGLHPNHVFWTLTQEHRFEVYRALRRVMSLRG